MGGIAFRQSLGVTGRRLESEQYFPLAEIVGKKLNTLFTKVHLVRAYKNKISHGDQDWLVSDFKIQIGPSLKGHLLQTFDLQPEFIHQNSNIYSLLIDGFQVDLTLVPVKYFDVNCFYMDDSPAGNALGKLYHKFGGSYGIEGLYYTLRDNHNTYKLGKIQISLDNEKITNFLGLDYSKKVNGFNDESDIFDWICSSKYFDHRIFSFENMNHIARTRDRKRPDYQRLMKYIDERFKDKVYDFPMKCDGINILNEYFPESNLLDEIKELKEKESERQELAKKFNGDLIMSWIPELRGPSLGKSIGEFKQYRALFSNYKTFNDYLLFNTEESIRKDFLEWYCALPI